jgi:hypothetical protein
MNVTVIVIETPVESDRLLQKRQTVSPITRLLAQSECWQALAHGPNCEPGFEADFEPIARQRQGSK